MREEIRYKPIGVIRNPFAAPEGVPIQPAAAKGVVGRAELDPGLADGLSDLDGFSHVILIYHFDRARPSALRVKPFLDSRERGVFATRSPARPNAIGISVVRLLGVEGSVLYIENVDIVDGTPLLDIKPYVPRFDGADDVRIGWVEGAVEKLAQTRDDGRFSERAAAQKGRQGTGVNHE